MLALSIQALPAKAIRSIHHSQAEQVSRKGTNRGSQLGARRVGFTDTHFHHCSGQLQYHLTILL